MESMLEHNKFVLYGSNLKHIVVLSNRTYSMPGYIVVLKWVSNLVIMFF